MDASDGSKSGSSDDESQNGEIQLQSSPEASNSRHKRHKNQGSGDGSLDTEEDSYQAKGTACQKVIASLNATLSTLETIKGDLSQAVDEIFSLVEDIIIFITLNLPENADGDEVEVPKETIAQALSRKESVQEALDQLKESLDSFIGKYREVAMRCAIITKVGDSVRMYNYQGDLPNLESLYQEELNILKGADGSVPINDQIRKWRNKWDQDVEQYLAKKLAFAPLDEAVEREGIASVRNSEAYVQTCPIMQLEITPGMGVKNENCGHIYSRAGFDFYKSKNTSRHKKAKCPVGGCPAYIYEDKISIY